MSGRGTVPSDPVLPHLPLALNGSAMAEVFAPLLRVHRQGLAVEACTVDRIKYRPRRNIVVSYRLRVRDAQSGEAVQQLVAARFCAAGESLRRYAKAVPSDPATGTASPTTSHVASLDMVAAWWPNDHKLGRSATLLGADSPARQRVLAEVLAVMTGGQGELVSHNIELVQVVPEDRAIARAELTYRTGSAGQAQVQTVYVKADAKRRGATTHAVMQALRRSGAQTQGRLLTPQPILWQADCGLHWQLALAGTPLLDESPQVSLAASSRVAALLAEMHSSAVLTPRRAAADDWHARLRLVCETLVSVEPGWESAVRSLASSLAVGVDAVCAEKDVTLHADLHPRNILVAGDRFGLIDLDSVCRGPAVADLGDWIADALYRALLGGQSIATALVACRGFVRAYAGVSGTPCSEASLAWSTANSLFCQRAWRSVVNLKPGRYALVEPLLDAAAAIARAGSIDAALQAPHRLAA